MPSLSLHSLTPAPRRRHKRVGRGNASGRGTYSGRGMKGQHARSGPKHIEARALKSFSQRIPKRGGFRSLKEKAHTITLEILDHNFEAKASVTPEILRKKHLAPAGKSVKIVATGKLSKALNIHGCAVSSGAREIIEKSGGKIN